MNISSIENPRQAASERARTLSFENLEGRIVELSSHRSSAVLTAATRLIVEVQRNGSPAAWVGSRERLFFPPDLVDSGVDLSSLVVVRVPNHALATRSADRLLRSGAFGLVVIDYGMWLAQLALPAQSRLASLAQKHRCIVACLTEKPSVNDSLGSLVSLRAQAQRIGTTTIELSALKDKRHGPGWSEREVCSGPAGLR
ncbi:MAG: recombinase A [Clostridia bacterium]|nr:recombinase A [Deltaproteobacteria bacterium]